MVNVTRDLVEDTELGIVGEAERIENNIAKHMLQALTELRTRK